MQTEFDSKYLGTATGQRANSILRSCVHCGFCTATCPTYLLTGNELDSPRGRIYLIKQMLEGNPTSKLTQTHLDRCLTCQSCESTCPSDVSYHELLDIGRAHLQQTRHRSFSQRLLRYLMYKVFSSRLLFGLALDLGRLGKNFLPASLQARMPEQVAGVDWPQLEHPRKMILLQGCVQQGLSPATNAATARVLDRLGIQAIPIRREGCCGSLAYHLDAQGRGLQQARHNTDLLCRQLDQGVEAIVSTASGCGNFIKDYARLLARDAAYAEKAARVSAHCRDISEVLAAEDVSALKSSDPGKLAFQCPCTLQHGQQLAGLTESLLSRLGFELTQVRDAHLCCGSAGTYSILQPDFARQLRENKMAALQAGRPDMIVTANIGCQSHLGAGSDQPVRHWIEAVEECMK